MRPFTVSSLLTAAFGFIGCLDPSGSPPEPVVVRDSVVAAERAPELSASDQGDRGCGPNGTACDDGNACTQFDECHSGVCRGSDLVTCASPDSCHERGTCDPATGACSNPPKPDGATCDDANACTQADTCDAGLCEGSELTCDADRCHARGTCNPGTGFCSYPAAVPQPSRCIVAIPVAPFEINGTCTEDTCVVGPSRFRRGQCPVRFLCVPE